MARIENWQEKYEKLEKLSQNHDTCNVTEFSKWIGISRQAFYNWKQNGFIIFQGHGNMPVQNRQRVSLSGWPSCGA